MQALPTCITFTVSGIQRNHLAADLGAARRSDPRGPTVRRFGFAELGAAPTLWKCAKESCFNWHNETLNIYTHLLPGLLCFTLAILTRGAWTRGMVSPRDADILLTATLSVGTCYLASALYHIFKDYSQKAHDIMNTIDGIGISIHTFGCNLLTIHCELGGEEAIRAEGGARHYTYLIATWMNLLATGLVFVAGTVQIVRLNFAGSSAMSAQGESMRVAMLRTVVIGTLVFLGTGTALCLS
eukprot:gene9752-11556_t